MPRRSTDFITHPTYLKVFVSTAPRLLEDSLPWGSGEGIWGIASPGTRITHTWGLPWYPEHRPLTTFTLIMPAQDSSHLARVTTRLPFFGRRAAKGVTALERESDDEEVRATRRPARWSFGVLNDRETVEVPGESPERVQCGRD